MTIQVTYSKARANLASLWDRVVEQGEVAILRRRGHRPVAMIDAEELAALEETAHLLRSPNNALRLLTALNRSLRGEEEPMSVAELRKEVGVEPGIGSG